MALWERQVAGDLAGHIAAAVAQASACNAPFDHLELDAIFPADVFAAMLANLPDARFYRPLRGRHRENVLPDGRCTRLKFDLLGEYVLHLPAPQRTLWREVTAALHDRRVRDALVDRFARVLGARFGKDFRDTGLMSLPNLIRDYPGYSIGIHPDTMRKVITVQFYLPQDERMTHIGTVFHARAPDGSFARARKMQFRPNAGYAFPVAANSWHSVDRLDASVPERNSLMLTYYLDSGVLGRMRNRVKRVASLVAYDARRLLRAA
jgi:hypothetical protein